MSKKVKLTVVLEGVEEVREQVVLVENEITKLQEKLSNLTATVNKSEF